MNDAGNDAPSDELVARRKRHATLAAALARKGYEVHRLEDGPFVIRRWNLQREVASIDEVESFARAAGAIR